ncbi:hypothetical protein Tdes44962_MAKER10001 [Teratosphaeria destructans]|uniref:Uncharacterized protein n=1 Tax=Teratosphaeria destructans TaxID=418781 RepID=A0A9W7W1T5_9PEZI|nr:hypothetical protein Tdes44962_MAKER10001 [Teratosphaeria destructans]
MDGPDMDLYALHGHEHRFYGPTADPPVDVDRGRSPQLDLVVCRSRCGCACASSRGDGGSEFDGTGGSGGSDEEARAPLTASGSSPEYGESVDGDEGARDEEIEVGDLGVFNRDFVVAALVKHARCRCHDPEQRAYGLGSVTSSGYLSSESMAVHHGSDLGRVTSRAMSISSGSPQSASARSLSSSGVLGFAGGQFDEMDVLAHPYTVGATPLQMSDEDAFAAAMEVTMHHGRHFSLEQSAFEDHSAYDTW